jgi:WD40 repeat protein
VAFSPDGSRIASGSLDGNLLVWDGQTFEQLGICEHDSEVYSVVFSPDSTLIVSGSADCTVRVWDAIKIKIVTLLVGHTGEVTSVVFFSDGTRIVSGSHDGTVRMWDARTYESLPGIQCSGPLWVVTVSPQCTRLALGQYTSNKTGMLRMFDVVTLEEQACVKMYQGIYIPRAVAFSPDGASIASGTEHGAVQVWDTHNLSNISTIIAHHGQVMSVMFTLDRSQIATGSRDGTVHIRPIISSHEQPTPIPGHGGRVSHLAFSSDGSRLVSGSRDNTVRIWDGLSCKELAVLVGHESVVWAVAYSPDGTRVISCSQDCTVRVWHALDFQELAVLKGHQDQVNFVIFSPDGAVIASCSNDQTVRLWSSSNFQELTRLEGPKDWVWSLAFSPSGTRVVSISRDNTVRVWDAINFAQLAELETYHQGRFLSSLMFSPDGKAILTHSDDDHAWISDDEQNCEKESSNTLSH